MADWDRSSITSQATADSPGQTGNGGRKSFGRSATDTFGVIPKTADDDDEAERRQVTKDQWTLLREHVRKNAAVINEIRQEMQAMKAQSEQAATEGLRETKKEHEAMKNQNADTARIVSEEKAARAAGIEKDKLEFVAVKQQVNDNIKAVDQNRHNIEDILQAQDREQDEKQRKLHSRMEEVEGRVGDTLAKHAADSEELQLKAGARAKEIEAVKVTLDSHKKTQTEVMELYKAEMEDKLSQLKQSFHRSLKDERNERMAHDQELEAAFLQKIEELKQDRDASRTTMIASIRTEISEVNKKAQQGLDGVAHDLAEEITTREGQGAAFKTIIENLERQQMAALTSRMDAMREQLDRDRQISEKKLAEVQKQSESATENVRKHADDMFKLLGDKTTGLTTDLKAHVADVVKQFDGVTVNMRNMRDDITKETIANVEKAKEDFNRLIATSMSPLDKRVGSVENRVADIENSCKALSTKTEDTSNELKALPAKITKEIGAESTAREAGDARGKEALTTVNNALTKRINDLITDLEAHGGKNASMLERLKQIEKTLQDHDGLHDNTKAKVAGVQDSVSSVLRKLEEDVAKEKATREGNVYELRELIGAQRTAHEGHCRSVKDTFDKEKAARDAHKADVDSNLQSQRDGLNKALDSRISEESSTRENKHASMQERIRYLEDVLQDSADKHAALSKDHGDKHNAHKSDLLSLKEQLETLRRLIDDEVKKEKAAREHDGHDLRELINVQKNVHELQCNTVREQFENERASREAQRDEVSGAMKKHREGISNQLEARVSEESANSTSRHSTIQERIKYLEDVIQVNLNKQAEVTKDHGDQHNNHKGSLIGMQEQLENIKLMIDTKVNQEQGSRKADVSQLRELLGAQKTSLDNLDARVKELFDKERTARSAMKDEVDSNLEKRADALTRAFDDRIKAEIDRLTKQNASIQERLAYLDSLSKDTSDKHDNVKKDHTEKHSQHNDGISALKEQLNAVQRQLLDGLTKETNGRVADVSHLNDLVAGQKLAQENYAISVKDMLDKERAAREALRGEVDENLSKHRDNTKNSFKEEKDARSTLQASIQDRIKYLEKLLSDSADKYAAMLKEQGVQRGKQDEFDGSLKTQASKHDALLKEHADLSGTQKKIEVSLNDVAARVGALTKEHGDLKDKVNANVVSVAEKLNVIDQKLANGLDNEKNLREAADSELKERVGAEKLAREGNFSSVKEVIEKERTVREEQLKKEREARDAAVIDLRAKLKQEVDTRSEEHADRTARLLNLEGVFHDTAEYHAKLADRHRKTEDKAGDQK